jgi:hypothetical protein
MKPLPVVKLVKNFDIFSLTTETTYSFHRDPDGNLWFAKGIRVPKKYANTGAEVYRFDGDTATKMVFEGNFLDGDRIDNRAHFAVDAAGTAYFYRPGFKDQPEVPLFAIDKTFTSVAWKKHPAMDVLSVKGKACRLEVIDPAGMYAVVDDATGRRISKFVAEETWGKTVVTKDRIFIFKGGCLEVHDSAGKLLRMVDFSDFEHPSIKPAALAATPTAATRTCSRSISRPTRSNRIAAMGS